MAEIRAALIRLSNVDEMLAKGMPLFREHWDEIAGHKDLMVLKPEESKYRALEDQGMLLALAAFDGEELVGYSVNFVMPSHLHYADLRICNNDILFVTKEARKGGLGQQLIAETERIARERGAQLMMWHCKPDTTLERLMARSYRKHDSVYSKEL